jgi:hypothetical protein
VCPKNIAPADSQRYPLLMLRGLFERLTVVRHLGGHPVANGRGPRRRATGDPHRHQEGPARPSLGGTSQARETLDRISARCTAGPQGRRFCPVVLGGRAQSCARTQRWRRHGAPSGRGEYHTRRTQTGWLSAAARRSSCGSWCPAQGQRAARGYSFRSARLTRCALNGPTVATTQTLRPARWYCSRPWSCLRRPPRRTRIWTTGATSRATALRQGPAPTFESTLLRLAEDKASCSSGLSARRCARWLGTPFATCGRRMPWRARCRSTPFSAC